MNTLLKVSQQTVWQLVGKATTSLSTIIILGLVSRSFGEEGTGVLTLALTFIGFFVLAVDFGLNAHVLPRFLGKDFSLEWQKLFGLRLLLALVVTTLAVIAILFWPIQPVFKYTALLGLVAILESAVFSTAMAVFQSKLRYDLSVFSIILGTLVTLGLVFLLVRGNAPVPMLMLGYSAGWITAGILAIVFVRRYIKVLLPIFDLGYIKNIIQNCWPISLTLVLNIVYFRLDAFILSFYKGFTEVGIYNLSYQVFQSLLVLPTFIMNGLYPLMLKDFTVNKTSFVPNITKACFLMLGIAVLGAGLTFFLSPFVVSLITGGEGFIGSVESLRVLSFGFPAFFISSVLMWALITMRKYKTMLLIYMAGLIVNILLNLTFIPKYSYFASAWITGITEYLILILQLIILIPLLKQWKR
ncbi:MAG: Polysaccharide biosynthesis protein, membrane-associated [Candidatus Daviesbacteria bacterium GW2011_GWA2_42_7]|uniref:Polysaccharide biosynthesis protein, membrane-associated n=1 Tax=Candidatus Daviesbacteria bacterium GW2011_GWA2_42_7 TaxID=1618425 RepID=A0A0G1B6K8_9BACT|nr:MAG: Polysaccharide biosynthesis protein, membrane-associated [Candidatus Daviesbacteria bacterium GW2011_GWA2_42_7]